jgi:hypothetical protein
MAEKFLRRRSPSSNHPYTKKNNTRRDNERKNEHSSLERREDLRRYRPNRDKDHRDNESHTDRRDNESHTDRRNNRSKENRSADIYRGENNCNPSETRHQNFASNHSADSSSSVAPNNLYAELIAKPEQAFARFDCAMALDKFFHTLATASHGAFEDAQQFHLFKREVCQTFMQNTQQSLNPFLDQCAWVPPKQMLQK